MVPAMPHFDDALASLAEPDRSLVNDCFANWAVHDDWRQIAANVRDELALGLDMLKALLRRFAEQLATLASAPSADTWKAAWCAACEPFELHGIEVPTASRPARLGRAWMVGSFARSISAARNHLSQDQAERYLRKYANKSPPASWEAQLRAGSLGGRVIWATFHPTDATMDPFACLPDSATSVRCALGLGFPSVDAEVLLLTYGTTAPAHGLPLHRPTIADANSYPFYRPHADISAYHGYTAPLPPNSSGLAPMPELVHQQINAAALILPYRIFG